MSKRRKVMLWFLFGVLGVAVVGSLVFVLVPMDMESRLDTNQVLPHPPFEIREEAKALHGSLTVADWHADTLQWLRDPLGESEVGQVDISRLAKGNMAIQVFTAVTRVPKGGINLQGNEAEGDRLVFLAVGDNWPAKVRKSLFERAAYQASRLCDSHRNIPDEMMLRIAKGGGLIGIGYWETAICGTSPGDIVEHIRYAIDLLGVEHVSLGSDYDGSVPMPFDVSELAILTQVMLDRGFREDEIRAVMGGNMVRFLSERLPGEQPDPG